MNRLAIAKIEDRLTVAAILVKSGYTVRLAKRKRRNNSTYDYFVEYWPNEAPSENGGSNES